jgi:hypothetical protein
MSQGLYDKLEQMMGKETKLVLDFFLIKLNYLIIFFFQYWCLNSGHLP